MVAAQLQTRDGRAVHARVVQRGHYNVRDLRGHWVAPRSAEMSMCPHACCQGRRPHPDGMPVKIDKSALRGMTDEELIHDLQRYIGFDRTDTPAYKGITAEIDRRDRAIQSGERARARRADREQMYRDEVYRQALQAEAQTNGYMLNKAGRAKDIDPISLFTGPESRVHRYGSDELIQWFEHHPRPTRQSILGTRRQQRNQTRFTGRR